MLKECDLPETKLFGFMFFKKKMCLIRKERLLKQVSCWYDKPAA